MLGITFLVGNLPNTHTQNEPKKKLKLMQMKTLDLMLGPKYNLNMELSYG